MQRITHRDQRLQKKYTSAPLCERWKGGQKACPTLTPALMPTSMWASPTDASASLQGFPGPALLQQTGSVGRACSPTSSRATPTYFVADLSLEGPRTTTQFTE